MRFISNDRGECRLAGNTPKNRSAHDFSRAFLIKGRQRLTSHPDSYRDSTISADGLPVNHE